MRVTSVVLSLTSRLSLAAAVACAPAPGFATTGFSSPKSIAKLFGANAVRVPRAVLNERWDTRRWPKLKGKSGPWTTLVEEAKGTNKAERLAMVNQWVNRAIRFEEDRDQYGESDRWSDIGESLRSGRGDCEDYAIAKLQLLRAVGFSTRDLYIAIVRDEELGLEHAVLVVRTKDGLALLDNQRDNIADPQAVPRYRPILSFNGETAWLYQYGLTSPTPQPSGARVEVVAGR